MRRAWRGLRVVILATAFLLLDHPQPVTGQQAANRPAGLVRIEHDGLLYTYHVLTGTEALFDLRTDPRSLHNLLPQRREEGQHLRRHLEAELKVDTLETLREGRRDEIRVLRSLGYL